jgi:hypothetical protein
MRRSSLDANFISYVVRNDINSMPPETRVDLSDADLDSIAAYLVGSAANRPLRQPRHDE